MAQVNFENDPTKLNDFNLVLAFDCHSHCNFGAFHSAQDSKDSIRSTQYGVIGKILNDTPDTYFTFGSNGQHVKVELEDIFDVNVEKLHEHSDYTIPAELVANITERKYAPPATTKTYSGYSGAGAHKSNAYLYEDYYTGGGCYGQHDNATGGDKAKTALITAINSFSSMYYLNTSKLKDLFVAFVAFVEEEALTQHLSTSFDIQAFENLVAQDIPMELDASLDYLFAEIQKEYDVVKGFKTKKTKNALVVSGSNTVDNITDVSTVDVVTETISEDVTTYNDTQKQAYVDGFEAAQLNITLVEALHWYSYTDSLAQCFKVGYEKAVKDYGLNPSAYEEI